MTRNSFTTLEITWTKEGVVCLSVRIGVGELWSHRGAAGSRRPPQHRSSSREEVLSTWLMAGSVGRGLMP